MEVATMWITVVGGTGRIGSRVVQKLRLLGHDLGHDLVAASPSTGVDAITRDGLAEALAGAEVVVDVVGSPSTDQGPATWFLSTSIAHILAEEMRAGVGHHVGLSIVGADRIPSGYFCAKLAQEERVRASGVRYSILRTSPCFEQFTAITDAGTEGRAVRLPGVPVQPVAADEVAAALAHLAIGLPLDGIAEIAGPERMPLDEAARRMLSAERDPREVVTDPEAPYLGAVLDPDTRCLLPSLSLTTTRLDDWLPTVTTP
jgi:uncharacterized protein YbjT (DUF2867 family)